MEDERLLGPEFIPLLGELASGTFHDKLERQDSQLDDLEQRVKRLMRTQNLNVDTAVELALVDPQAGTVPV